MDYYQQQGTESFGGPQSAQKRPQRGPTCDSDEQTELKEKVVIPLEKYPGYNFVGSILGPQGSILKALQKGVNAKISIFGKGSMRDKEKEKELYTSEDPEHAHLKEPLHVLIEVKAPRADAHWRMANALTEVYKFMVPPPDHQRGGPDNGAGYGYGNEGSYDQGYGGGPGMRGGRGGGPPRGGPAPRGGPPPRGGRGGAPPPRGGRGAPRGGRGGMLSSRGGAAPPAAPAAADAGYGYGASQEPTNYQWDGNYSQTNYNTTGYPSQTAAGAEQNANGGYGMKRPYEQSYDQQGYGTGY